MSDIPLDHSRSNSNISHREFDVPLERSAFTKNLKSLETLPLNTCNNLHTQLYQLKHPYPKLNVKVLYIVPYLKFQFPSTVVNIALLSTLDCFHPLSNESYFVSSILNHIRPQQLSLANFVPTQ